MADEGKLTFKESRIRSLVKSVIYRILSICGTGILTWLITRELGKTLSITLASQIFLICLYYLSERVWNRVHWGKKLYTTNNKPKQQDNAW